MRDVELVVGEGRRLQMEIAGGRQMGGCRESRDRENNKGAQKVKMGKGEEAGFYTAAVGLLTCLSN